MALVKVVALQRGHDGASVREQGEEFELDLAEPRYKDCTWFVQVDKAPKPKKADPNAPPPGAGPRKGSAPAAPGPDDIA